MSRANLNPGLEESWAQNPKICLSDDGGGRAAAIYTLIETAKLNGLDPEAYLRDILARIATHPARQIDDLLPWTWAAARSQALAA